MTATARAWLERYLEVSLRPLTRLLVRHGIGLEAHTQNSLVALDDGWPARFVVRDLEGVSLNRDHPAAGGGFGGSHRRRQPGPLRRSRGVAPVRLLRARQPPRPARRHAGRAPRPAGGRAVERGRRASWPTRPSGTAPIPPPRRCASSSTRAELPAKANLAQRARRPQRAPRLGGRPEPAAVRARRCMTRRSACPRCGGGSCASSSSRCVYERRSDRSDGDRGPRRAGPCRRYRWTARRRFSFDRVRLGPGPVLRCVAGAAPVGGDSPRSVPRRDRTGADRPIPTGGGSFATELHADHRQRHRRPAGTGEAAAVRAAGAASTTSSRWSSTATPTTRPTSPGWDSTPADNAAYGPEFARPIRPVRVALRRDWWPGTPFPASHPTVVGDRVVLPVHPWQWRRHASTTWAALLADGALVPLGTGDDDYRAQQSIRSLANVTRPEQPTLKLALSIVNTSTARTLAPHTVANAPLITGWLQGIAAGDPYLAGELRPVLLGERLGVAHSPELAAIWRDSLHRLPGRGGAGSAVHRPLPRRRHRRAVHRPVGEGAGCRVVGPAAARGHRCAGAALPGRPRHRPRGPRPEPDPDPRRRAAPAAGAARLPRRHPLLPWPAWPIPPAGPRCGRRRRSTSGSTATPTSRRQSDDEVRDFVHDCLFFVNLAELAMFLEDRFDLAEERFWSLARRVVEDHRRRFPELAGRAARFDVLAPEVSVEQLTDPPAAARHRGPPPARSATR